MSKKIKKKVRKASASPNPANRLLPRLLMARDIQDKHVLDTSVWNNIYDDSERDRLIKVLRTKVILPTALAISESAAIAESDRRHAIIRLMKTLGGDNRPLAMPNQLIILACQAYSRRDRNFTLNAGEEAEGAWIAINHPELVDSEAQKLTLTFNEEREDTFRRYFEGLRALLQPQFINGLTRPRSFKELVRHYTVNDDLMYKFVNDIYEQAVGQPLRRDSLGELIRSLPCWRLFLLSCVYAAYRRAIKQQGFGWKKNAGALDLWSAVYLTCADTFVTHDKHQRRALSVLNRGSRRVTRIVSFTQWRQELLSNQDVRP
jgi:hypothetical protein